MTKNIFTIKSTGTKRLNTAKSGIFFGEMCGNKKDKSNNTASRLFIK